MWHLKHNTKWKLELKLILLWWLFNDFGEVLAKKSGFRGGAKSYAIKVEANTVGTNLQYELPESKVKAASPNDWLVDNDNAEMTLAINSPVLAKVMLKHPKFSMKGQWPGYKVSIKPPKDVTSTKKHEFLRTPVAITEKGKKVQLENSKRKSHMKNMVSILKNKKTPTTKAGVTARFRIKTSSKKIPFGNSLSKAKNKKSRFFISESISK